MAKYLLSVHSVEGEGDLPASAVADALVAFEAWYVAGHDGSFWTLFEHAMPQTPVVDF